MNPPNPTHPPCHGHRGTAGRRQARRTPPAPSVIAMAVIAAVFVLAVLGGAHCGLLRSGSAPPRPPQPVLTSHAGPFAAIADQPHLDHRPATLCQKAFTGAV